MLAVTRQHRGDGIARDESRMSCQLGVCFVQALQELGVTLGRGLPNGSERAVQELVEQGDVLLVLRRHVDDLRGCSWRDAGDLWLLRSQLVAKESAQVHRASFDIGARSCSLPSTSHASGNA